MSETEPVQCPTCRNIQQVDSSATDYTCALCNSDWQWAICGACNTMSLALAGQESWRCCGCARYTRSWWRTSSHAHDAGLVRQRRALERAAVEQTRRAVPHRMRRRWLSVAGAGALVLVPAIVAVVALANGGTPTDQSHIACAKFGEVRSAVSNGAVSRTQLAVDLAAIGESASQGTEAVAVAARRLEAAAEPGTAAFLVAQTQLARACGTLSDS